MMKLSSFLIVQVIIHFPKRLSRLGFHFLPIKSRYSNPFPPASIKEWFTDTFFYIIDVFGMPEWFQVIHHLTNWNIRPLSPDEKTTGYQIFGDTINYDLVKVNSNSRWATKKFAIAYVSFNIINYKNKIRKETFIHELMHVWQYQNFGSIYIAKAIKAQLSKEGYDYGGVENLYQGMLCGKSLLEFNFEQQADIIEDFYNLTRTNDHANDMILSIYRYYALQLKDGEELTYT
jgi:hypothetical protein